MNFDWRDLDMQNYAVWPITIKVIAMVIIFCLILFFGYCFDTRSQLRSLTIAQKHEETLKQTFLIKQRSARDLLAYQKQVQELHQKFNKLTQTFPKHTEVVGVLEEISKIAATNGLKLQAVKPLPVEPYDFYVELPINVSLLGDYHQLAQFISDVAALPLMVTLNDFQINQFEPQTKSDHNEAAITNTQLKMLITIKTYWGRDETK